ncbi:MAG TPA: ATP-binding cassette domain-containing protein [Chthoniobacterales bacterium]|nr:ATP-binding cassette domain-containing protein [Chthoniobacterales bacterium]
MAKQTNSASFSDPAQMSASELVFRVAEMTVSARGKTILRDVKVTIRAHEVFGIIGPSGAGKSTFLRCLNRLSDLTPELRVTGEIRFHGQPIRDAAIDPDALRARIGFLFQQPVVFPKSVLENVVFGVRHLRRLSRAALAEAAERALIEASLWNEVRDRLDDSALTLSVGQQQRLCLARALATEPDVILMDEPTSALDPKSTQAIEELILKLKERHTIVLVTHNVVQARRVTDWLACICVRDGAGTIVETACCDAMLENPQCQEVVEYLDGGTTLS